jgi:hypothetical protein
MTNYVIRVRCGCFTTDDDEQCVLESDHDGAHRFASEGAMLSARHAESIEYVVAMLDQIAPRSGGADNRALAREAAQIIRRVAGGSLESE